MSILIHYFHKRNAQDSPLVSSLSHYGAQRIGNDEEQQGENGHPCRIDLLSGIGADNLPCIRIDTAAASHEASTILIKFGPTPILSSSLVKNSRPRQSQAC